MFKEVKHEMLKVVLINTFLDSVIVFFLIFFVASLFNIKFFYILIIPCFLTLVFFFASMTRRVKKLRLKSMEDANPQVKEMLRTAYDSQEDENIMTHALFEDVKKKLKTASSGNMLESKKIVVRVISAVVVVFLIIFISSINIHLGKIDVPFEKLKFMIPGKNPGEELGAGEITELIFNETDVTYGESSIAKLGNEKIDISMNPSMSEIDFDEISEAEDNELREGGLPQEIGINPDEFSNQEVLDEAEQAANYSQRIKDI